MKRYYFERIITTSFFAYIEAKDEETAYEIAQHCHLEDCDFKSMESELVQFNECNKNNELGLPILLENEDGYELYEEKT